MPRRPAAVGADQLFSDVKPGPEPPPGRAKRAAAIVASAVALQSIIGGIVWDLVTAPDSVLGKLSALLLVRR